MVSAARKRKSYLNHEDIYCLVKKMSERMLWQLNAVGRVLGPLCWFCSAIRAGFVGMRSVNQTGVHTQKVSVLGLVLCCLESLDNFIFEFVFCK